MSAAADRMDKPGMDKRSMEERERRIRERNRALAILLFALVALFFLITVVRLSGG